MAFEDYDVKLAFARIENELIASMMRNLKRHLKEEEEEEFDWSQWQVEQLKYLQEYRRRNQKEYGPRFSSINAKMEEAIRFAHENGQKDEELNILDAISKDKRIRPRYQNPSQASIEGAGDAFFRVNDRKLEALVEATHSDLEKAEQAVLRRTNDQYRKIIFDAQMYANTGAGTIEKAVDMATKDFLAKGIDSIQYKNGARHTISDYADMYIRTAERRAYLMGEGKKRQEWGEQLVIVNRRGTMTAGNYGHACPQCIPWLGKILIDDVYSGGKPDGKHQLLSDAMAAGFLHPRCKDGFTTYFPGISPQEDPVTKKEVREAVEAEKEENRLQYAERQQERYERLAEYSLDPENKRLYEDRAEQWKENELGIKRKMSAPVSESNAVYIDWPKPTHKTTDQEFKAIRKYANDNGIGLAGIRNKWIDLQTAKEVIDGAIAIIEEYGLEGKIPEYVMDFSNPMETGVFSCTYEILPGRVFFNSLAFGNRAALKEEYKKLVKRRWFVKGTDFRSLVYHEFGHIVADIYGIDSMAIAKRILGTATDVDTLEEVKKQLSRYAADAEDGSEIISECFSAVYGGADNSFALRFLEECDKIISRKR